jgi:hypothetical protein
MALAGFIFGSGAVLWVIGQGQLTIYEGAVKWLEPVTDEQYKAAQHR